MTETGGPAWRQTIFHPFAQFSRFGRGTVLRAQVESPEYSARYYDPRGAADLWFPLTAPYLSVAAVHDAAAGTLTLFALNRNTADELSLEILTEGFGMLECDAAEQLRHDDLDATNTREHPDRVIPSPLNDVSVMPDRVRATLAPGSWNVVRLRIAGAEVAASRAGGPAE